MGQLTHYVTAHHLRRHDSPMRSKVYEFYSPRTGQQGYGPGWDKTPSTRALASRSAALAAPWACGVHTEPAAQAKYYREFTANAKTDPTGFESLNPGCFTGHCGRAAILDWMATG